MQAQARRGTHEVWLTYKLGRTYLLGTAAYYRTRTTGVSPGSNVSGNVGEVISTALCHLPTGERCSRGSHGAS